MASFGTDRSHKTIIGERIKRERVKRRLTREQLANQMNVSDSYIKDIENNISKIDMRSLDKVCAIFQCSILDLVV